MTSVHSGPYMSIDMIPGKYSCVLEKKIHRVSRCGVRVYTFVCVCMYDWEKARNDLSYTSDKHYNYRIRSLESVNL